ncbi:MAG: hypothetical protein JNJ99_04525, partial [Crocinitomicaceae bacterium]|nr:hypothetical protein [Crocinitomicaceae bacterium]
MKKYILFFSLLFSGFSHNFSVAQCGGSCGGFAGFCWCDDFCWIALDCCPDVCTACGSTGPNWNANCAPPPPPPPPPCGTPVVFNFSGGMQNYTIPAGVTSITYVVEGGQGGGVQGGGGAIVTGTLTVTPGQVLQISVGGQGNCPGTVYGGGGTGQNSGVGIPSCSGGGASYISTGGGMAGALVVAGGGGGTGGADTGGEGGDGGCPNGTAGETTFGFGGGGGTSVSGGLGGAPWTPGGGSGGNGGFGTGGAGAV